MLARRVTVEFDDGSYFSLVEKYDKYWDSEEEFKKYYPIGVYEDTGVSSPIFGYLESSAQTDFHPLQTFHLSSNGDYERNISKVIVEEA